MTVQEAEHRVAPEALMGALQTTGVAAPDARLLDVHEQPVGIGQAADTLLLTLSWAEPASGPATVVAKVPSADQRAAQTMRSLGGYEREARFYQELAPRLEVSVPACYGTLSQDGVPVAVLLEDLSGLSVGDQLSDLPTTTLTAARRQLALLQAPFWDDPELAGTPWLHRRLGVEIPAIVERMQNSWAHSRGYLAEDFDDEERDQIDRFVAGAGEWAASLTGPFTLTHHDFRVDNLLFGPDRLVVLDWQTVGWGPPMFDVAYLLGTSVSPEVRRRIERDQVAGHVADLAQRGVNWTEAQAWTAYRQASFATLLMLVPPTGSVKRSERGDAMFRRLLRSGARMALDLDADEFLPTQPARTATNH